MVNQEVLNTKTLRTRIMELEYQQLTEEDIKKIYIEETGKKPPATIKVYHSQEYKDPNTDGYGFNGTIIHFYDEKKEVNQAYTIPRGTEPIEGSDWRPLDWTYNLMGVFVGQNAKQYESAADFDHIVTKIIEEKSKNVELEKIGLGHSLGGNLIILLQLTTEQYENVHVVNAAPPTFYELSTIDDHFLEFLANKFNINPNNPEEIYNLNPDKLKKIAENYYKEAGANITHTTTIQDVLQSVLHIRGFFKVGKYDKPYDAFPDKDIEGIAELVEKIPDSVVRDIQIYLAENLSDVYNEDGFDGLLQALTGIDAALIDDLIEYEGIEYIKKGSHLVKNTYKMIKDVSVKLPGLIVHIEALYKQLDPILDAFVELDYITTGEKKVIIGEVNGIKKDLNSILEIAKGAINLNPNVISLGIRLYASIKQIKDHYNSIFDRIDVIKANLGKLQELLSSSVDAHGLDLVINAIYYNNNRSLSKSGDLIYSGSFNGKEMKVNISAATRIYQEGMMLVNAKTIVLEQMKRLYEEQYLDDYVQRKRKLIQQFDDMETNPSHYNHLLGSYSYDSEQVYKLTKIRVHDYIEPLPYNGFKAIFENIFSFIEKEVAKEIELLDNIRASIEVLFEEEEKIAKTLFNLEV